MATKKKEPTKRILIDLPLWVSDAFEKECLDRRQKNKPLRDRKTYIEKLCIAHAMQQLVPKQKKEGE